MVRKFKMKIYADRTRTCLSFIAAFKAGKHSVDGHLNGFLYCQQLLIGITIVLTILLVYRMVWDEIFQKWETGRDIYVICQVMVKGIEFEIERKQLLRKWKNLMRKFMRSRICSSNCADLYLFIFCFTLDSFGAMYSY